MAHGFDDWRGDSDRLDDPYGRGDQRLAEQVEPVELLGAHRSPWTASSERGAKARPKTCVVYIDPPCIPPDARSGRRRPRSRGEHVP
ncbi:hypothetical protein GCM10009593_32210 [Microlunatus antarcticus]